MKGEWLFYAYGVLSLLAGILLTFRFHPQRTVLSVIIVFWVLGGSIIQQGLFDLPLKQLGGNLQVQQLFFVVMMLYVATQVVLNTLPAGGFRGWKYEKYYIVFMVAFFGVVIYHYTTGLLTLREVRGLTEGTLLVALVYVSIRRYGDRELLATIAAAILLLGIVTAVVSIIQFFFLPDFLRVGVGFGAFGERLRSKGVFSTEYLNAFCLLMASVTALFWIPRKELRWLLIVLYGVAVVLTFHRMSWLAGGLVMVLYLGFTQRKHLFSVVGIGIAWVVVMIGIGLVLDPTISELVSGSEVFRSRLTADTMTDRFRIYSMVVDHFDRIALLGAGSTRSSLYYHGMMGTGVADEQWALGQRGSIHNGYLEILFFYGLPVFILYTVVLIRSLWELLRKTFTSSLKYAMPALMLVIFITMNLTNSLLWNNTYGIYMAIMLGIGISGPVMARSADRGSTQNVNGQ